MPRIERDAECILTREDILGEIRRRSERAEVIREPADDDGIYLLEASEEGESAGESTHYIYKRKGIFPDKNEAVRTVLEKVYFINDVACGGCTLANYDNAMGEWVEKLGN